MGGGGHNNNNNGNGRITCSFKRSPTSPSPSSSRSNRQKKMLLGVAALSSVVAVGAFVGVGMSSTTTKNNNGLNSGAGVWKKQKRQKSIHHPDYASGTAMDCDVPFSSSSSSSAIPAICCEGHDAITSLAAMSSTLTTIPPAVALTSFVDAVKQHVVPPTITSTTTDTDVSDTSANVAAHVRAHELAQQVDVVHQSRIMTELNDAVEALHGRTHGLEGTMFRMLLRGESVDQIVETLRIFNASGDALQFAIFRSMF